MLNLRSILTPTQRVKFDYFRDGYMWYSTQNGFQFPVNVNGLTRTLMPNGKAIDFEYWIKKEYYKQKEQNKNA